MCFLPSSCSERTASCSAFCPYTCPHKLGLLLPWTATVSKKVNLWSLTNPLTAGLKPLPSVEKEQMSAPPPN